MGRSTRVNTGREMNHHFVTPREMEKNLEERVMLKQEKSGEERELVGEGSSSQWLRAWNLEPDRTGFLIQTRTYEHLGEVLKINTGVQIRIYLTRVWGSN